MNGSASTPVALANKVREQLNHPILHRFNPTGEYVEMAEGEHSSLYRHDRQGCPGCSAEEALGELLRLAEGTS